MQGSLKGGGGEGDRRRHTLVFGGWERDTKKDKLLAELNQAVRGLSLSSKTSEQPFTTGPRKSVALLNFPLLPGESDDSRRRRMHEIVVAIGQAKVYTSSSKKLWCSYSKTRQQRDISGHCSWVKRALAHIDEGLIPEIDVEYSSGSVWMGESLIASSLKQPNDGAKSEKMMTGKGSPPGWVDLERFSRESKLAESELREALDATRK